MLRNDAMTCASSISFCLTCLGFRGVNLFIYLDPHLDATFRHDGFMRPPIRFHLDKKAARQEEQHPRRTLIATQIFLNNKQRSMSSSFGGFSFPGIPVAGGVPLGMIPHSTTVISSGDAGIGTGAGTGIAPLSVNSNDKTKQLQDRRERAKLHARKCREKKKHELENLIEEEKLLREENLRLRALIRSKMPDQAQNIVSECCYSSERVRHLNPYMFQQAVGDDGEGMKAPSSRSLPAQLGRNDFDLIESLSAGKQSFVLTDPRLPDNPIVFCSDSFCELTGYTRNEVVGRNCRFLQTIGTDPSAVEQVRRAIESGTDCTTVMLNAKADGTTFWNRFFVAPLRDRRGRIVNYVGVQTDSDDPTISDECNVGMEKAADGKDTTNATKELTIKRIPDTSTTIDIDAANVEPMPFFNDPESPVGGEGEVNDEDLGDIDIDWVGLAEALEKDHSGALEEISQGPKEWGSSWIDKLGDGSNESAGDIQDGSTTSSRYVQLPRLFTTKVVRSEVINALLSSYGDVTDSRFVGALDVLSSFYKSSRTDVTGRDLYRQLMNGSWRSLSRPAFQGCLGMKSDGSFVYELGTMSFGMFRPANLRCSIQNTLTHISPATRPSDGSPTIAPWSLRRELAVFNDGEGVPNGNISDQNYSMLKTYDIAMSLTVEPAEDDSSSPAVTPVQAVKLVKGYMLPDPSVPNRLTVWFVGGELRPVVSGDEASSGFSEVTAPAEWKEMFGRDQKKTWSDSIRNAGAKLFLGAELPHGMSTDGSLSYQLHRPHGGHGVAYIDVLYYDEHVLVTRGNRGTVYVASRQEDTSAIASSHSSSTGFPFKVGPLLETNKKRKVSDIGDNLTSNSMMSDQGEAKKSCSIKSLPPTVSPMSSSLADAASRAERRDSGINHRPKAISPTVYPLPENQTHDIGGVRNILQSVEGFFSWGK